jgi:hypothetical protein
MTYGAFTNGTLCAWIGFTTGTVETNEEATLDSIEKPSSEGNTRNAEEDENRDSARCPRRERRKYKRHDIRFGVSYASPSSRELTHVELVGSCAIDVCRRGMSLLVDEPVPVPALLRVQLYLTGLCFGSPSLCRSVHCSINGQPGTYRLGLEFIGNVPWELRRLIDDL